MLERHVRLFFALVALSILVMAYQSRTGPLRPFWFLVTSANYLNSSISSMSTAVRDTFRRMTLNETELKRLREEVRTLRLDAMQQQERLIENSRLRLALALKEQEPGYVGTARVVSRGGGEWSHTFVIDKGEDDLVRKDMAVVTPDGLLGKVIETEASFSRILLIDDPLFSVAVRLQDERVEGVLSGEGHGRCRLKYIEVDSGVDAQEVIVTSGLDGLFPPGIRVGVVTRVTTNEKELFHDIEARPFVNSRKVEEVTIVSR